MLRYYSKNLQEKLNLFEPIIHQLDDVDFTLPGEDLLAEAKAVFDKVRDILYVDGVSQIDSIFGDIKEANNDFVSHIVNYANKFADRREEAIFRNIGRDLMEINSLSFKISSILKYCETTHYDLEQMMLLINRVCIVFYSMEDEVEELDELYLSSSYMKLVNRIKRHLLLSL